MLEELEGGIGAAVGELVDLLGPAERRMVRDMVTNMYMAAGVAAARGAARSVPAPGSVGRHVVVGELAAADWQPLLTAARAAAGASLGQEMARAADWRERGKKGRGADGKPRGPARSQRQHDALLAEPSAYEEYCQKIEAKAEEAHKELVAAVVAVENAIKAYEEFDAAECEGPEDSMEGEGELVALMKYVLGVHGISIQRYWNGALVGPDCRTLLEKHGEILGAIRQGIVAAGYGDADAKDFVHRHTALLKELEVVSRITRRVKGEGESGLLLATERAELKRSCAAFGAAWRESYRRILTPKAHIVDVHVDHYGICGVFGEDGAEVVHVVDNLCRRLVRQMCNPEDRHKAHPAPCRARLHEAAGPGDPQAAVGEAEGGEGGGGGSGGGGGGGVAARSPS